MARFFVATIRDGDGGAPALVRDGTAQRIAGAGSVREMLADWSSWLARLDDGRDLDDPEPLSECALMAPVDPPNLYMVGANYADHAREMQDLGPDEPVPRPPSGPFFFLKPTTTMIGDGEPVVIGEGVERLDWEVELAAVIGRRAHRVAASAALDHVAGYMILNDVSARDAFVRPA